MVELCDRVSLRVVLDYVDRDVPWLEKGCEGCTLYNTKKKKKIEYN